MRLLIPISSAFGHPSPVRQLDSSTSSELALTAQGRDHVIEVRQDILREHDGPMLIHGLQELHSKKIVAPKSVTLAPDPGLLEQRYEEFRKVG